METGLLFNLSTKANSNGSAVEEGVHYKVWKTGKSGGLGTKICNFENEDICPRKGIVELHAFKVSRNINKEPRHRTSLKIDKVYDANTGIFYGIPERYDEKNDRLLFKPIYLEETNIFNLANPDDAMKWAVIKNSYFVEGSPNAHDRKLVMYRVYDSEREAELYISRREIKRKAETIASGLFGAQLLETGLALGLHVDEMSPAVMLMRVCQIAESDPKRFMDIWDSPTKLEITVLNRALATGVIVHDIQTGLMYNALSLGISEALAVDYLRNNAQIRDVIDQQSRAKQNDSLKAMSEEAGENIKDSKDAILAKANKEIEALKAQLAATTKVKTDEIVDKISFDLPDLERKELLEEAKHFKLQGAHKQDNEKIRSRIADAKAKIEAE